MHLSREARPGSSRLMDYEMAKKKAQHTPTKPIDWTPVVVAIVSQLGAIAVVFVSVTGTVHIG